MFFPSSRQQSDALVSTLARAHRAPHYARTWGQAWTRVRDARGLVHLPVLTKEDAAEHQEDLRVPGVSPSPDGLLAGVVSSATTRTGRPLRVLRSAEELGGHAVVDDAGSTSSPAVRQRTLVLFSPRHGVRLQEGPGRVLLPVTPHPNTVDVLVDLLQNTQGPPFRFLVAPVSALKWITVAMQERGLQPHRLGIREVGTNGYTLTRHARDWLGAAWGARMWDNYSLSEVPGFAWECGRCGFLHWEGARVVAELLDPHSRKPVKGPLGELVLTTLWPDVQLMPLIRYATGDLVWRGPRCPEQGTRGVRFAGRVGQGLQRLVKGVTTHVLLARDLLEWAEATPDVAQHPHPLERMGTVPPSDIGVPKALVDAARGVVRVELRFDPLRHPARVSALESQLRSTVFRRGNPRPVVEWLRPGSLDVTKLALKL